MDTETSILESIRAEYATAAPAQSRPRIAASANEASDEPATYPAPVPGECWDDPHRIARLYVERDRTAEGEPTLIQWRGEFHRWARAAWVPVADADLSAWLVSHCRAVFEADLPFRPDRDGKPPALFRATAQVVTNVRLNLAGLVNVPDTGADAPFWRCDPSGRPEAAEVIAAPNGLFTVAGIAAGDGPFSAPTPQLFTPNALPFEVQAEAPRPVAWERCLRDWFGDDPRSILGLQEWLGYLLSANTSAHKILMLVGPPRSGKGTILRVINELVGAGNVGSTSFAALGANFGLEALLNKRVAVIPDARLSGKSDVAAVVERLLSISGEDVQTIDRKHRPRVTAKIGARFVIASNEIPRLPDSSGAVASRFHIISTPNSFRGKEDAALFDKLRAELPSILQWAARGYVRLRAQRFAFTANDVAEQHQRELEDLSSPVKAFVRERCEVGPTCEVRVEELFAAWLEWNGDNNRVTGSQQIFGRDLRSAFPHLVVAQPRVNGRQIRVYRGIGMRSADEPERSNLSF